MSAHIHGHEIKPEPLCGCKRDGTKSCESHPVIPTCGGCGHSAKNHRGWSDGFTESELGPCQRTECGCSRYKKQIAAPPVIDSASRLREQEERDISALASLCEAENRYRIERCDDVPAKYWNRGLGWLAAIGAATLYNEVERMADLNGPGYSKLLPGGCWVLLDPVATIECDGCSRTHRGGTARQLAEAVYALGWLVMTTGVACKSCQANNGAVSEEDARVDEDKTLNGDL